MTHGKRFMFPSDEAVEGQSCCPSPDPRRALAKPSPKPLPIFTVGIATSAAQVSRHSPRNNSIGDGRASDTMNE